MARPLVTVDGLMKKLLRHPVTGSHIIEGRLLSERLTVTESSLGFWLLKDHPHDVAKSRALLRAPSPLSEFWGRELRF